jgi:hypothetical protein
MERKPPTVLIPTIQPASRRNRGLNQSTSQEAISPTASANKTALAAGMPQTAHTRALATTSPASATRYLKAKEIG